VDYPGIGLVALGFACLEVVLDRGQKEDWLQSGFIAVFLIIAIAAIAAAIFWELHHDDPVIELALLKERNFAIANGIYFLFGFVLFGSTVLIPQMLQSLYGYTATDAGLVLGPGALVIVVMAPIVVRMVKRIPAAWLIGVGFAILGASMLYFGSFSLGTDYTHEAWARALEGLGIAFLFVPTSQLAYSYLPKNKNNKASSLTNLARNWGGSFGVAFVTTMAARRAQYHQSVLVAHISNFDQALNANLAGITNRFVQHGYAATDGAVSALRQIYAMLQQQAAMLAFLDCFWLLGIAALAGPLLALFIRKFQVGGQAAGH
jgi:DHA2 family multidrug resistance protein